MPLIVRALVVLMAAFAGLVRLRLWIVTPQMFGTIAERAAVRVVSPRLRTAGPIRAP